MYVTLKEFYGMQKDEKYLWKVLYSICQYEDNWEFFVSVISTHIEVQSISAFFATIYSALMVTYSTKALKKL